MTLKGHLKEAQNPHYLENEFTNIGVTVIGKGGIDINCAILS